MASWLSFLRNPRVKRTLGYLAGAGATYAFINNTEAQDKRLWENCINHTDPFALQPLSTYCLSKFAIRRINPIVYTSMWPITMGSTIIPTGIHCCLYVVWLSGYFTIKLMEYPAIGIIYCSSLISNGIWSCVSIDEQKNETESNPSDDEK